MTKNETKKIDEAIKIAKTKDEVYATYKINKGTTTLKFWQDAAKEPFTTVEVLAEYYEATGYLLDHYGSSLESIEEE